MCHFKHESQYVLHSPWTSYKLTFNNQLKKSFPGDEPHCHLTLVAAGIREGQLGELGLFVQFNIILIQRAEYQHVPEQENKTLTQISYSDNVV